MALFYFDRNDTVNLKRRQFVTFVGATLATATSKLSAEDDVSPVDGYSYQLPKIADGATLLFQGDSITDMKWGRKQSDRNHYLGHSYVFLIAARLHTEMPKAKLNFLNRGMSGHSVGDLRKRWQKDALDLNPDVLSVLIGVNDVGRAIRGGKTVDVKAFEDDYRSILIQSRAANPKLKIVLIEPFVLPVTRLRGDAWKSWKGEIDRLRPIIKQLATEFHAIHLPMQSVFESAAKRAEPSHWIWDGVHPLPQGHELIARNWIQATAKAW